MLFNFLTKRGNGFKIAKRKKTHRCIGHRPAIAGVQLHRLAIRLNGPGQLARIGVKMTEDTIGIGKVRIHLR